MKQIFKAIDKYFWLFFLIWLISYLVAILLYIPREVVGDEGNYLRLAENLTKGFYSPPPPGVHLWYGIGYPLFLTPWVALGFPTPLIRLINAPMLYGAVLLVYQGVKALTKNAQTALIAAAAFASYPPFYLFLPKIMTEIFAVLLISGFCYFILRTRRKTSWIEVASAAILLALIMLTKPIWGFVTLAAIVLLVGYYLLRKDRQVIRFGAVLVTALLLNSPYLFYTHSLTGKWFYWSSAGGMSLYTMSSPYPDEYGDWFNWYYHYKPQRELNHKGFMEPIRKLDQVRRDDLLKKKALENILDYPGKYFKNVLANTGRLFFYYPFSYTPQTLGTYIYMAPNMFVFLLLCFSIGVYPMITRSSEINFLIIITSIYFGGTLLLSAFSRMLAVVMPILVIFISYVLSKIRIRFT